MAKNMYGIPGAAVYVKDYQIKPEAITTPGDVVVLLADMPDTIDITDPKDSMKLKTIPLTPNTPILITNTDDLSKVITGEAVIGGTVTNKTLDIVNVLSMINGIGTKPLAICKITKRDGTRPDMTNKLEIYEALENAYESLGNYPAGAIVPIGISFEDSFNETYISKNFKITKDVAGAGVNIMPIPATLFDSFTVDSDSFALTEDFSTTISIAHVAAAATATVTIGGITPTVVPVTTGTVDRYIDTPEAPVVTEVGIGGALEAFKTYSYKVTFSDGVSESATSVATDYLTTDETNKTITVTLPKCLDDSFVITKRIIYRDVDGNGIFTKVGEVSDNTTATFEDAAEKAIGADAPVVNALKVSENVLKATAATTIAVKTGLSINIPQNAIIAIDGKTLKGNLVAFVQSSNYFKIARKFEDKIHNNEIVIKDGVGEYAPTKAQSFVIELKKTVEGKGYVLVNGDIAEMLEPGALAAEYIDLDGTSNTALKDYDVVLDDGLIMTITAGAKFDNAVAISTVNSTVETSFGKTEANTYVINTVPMATDPVTRALEFCWELTKDLNECRAYFGTMPPENNSAKKIKLQTERLVNLPKSKMGFEKVIGATEKVDLGAYLVVLTGAQKVNGIGGILGFDEEEILSNVSAPTYVVETARTLLFAKDDTVEIYGIKGIDIVVQGAIKVIDVEHTLTRTKITLSAQLDYNKFKGLNQVYIQNINKKDNTGSYLAALYAVVANNYGIDKAPMNVTLPGEAEVLYTRQQSIALNINKYTIVNRESTGTTGFVVDTPTMARDDSDFTDQSSIGLLLYFTAKLRAIAKAKQGQRFGSADVQLMFKKELETPLEAEKGKSIVDFYLKTDFRLLNTQGMCLVEFGIKEAKTLKFIKFVARLY